MYSALWLTALTVSETKLYRRTNTYVQLLTYICYFIDIFFSFFTYIKLSQDNGNNWGVNVHNYHVIRLNKRTSTGSIMEELLIAFYLIVALWYWVSYSKCFMYASEFSALPESTTSKPKICPWDINTKIFFND